MGRAWNTGHVVDEERPAVESDILRIWRRILNNDLPAIRIRHGRTFLGTVHTDGVSISLQVLATCELGRGVLPAPGANGTGFDIPAQEVF